MIEVLYKGAIPVEKYKGTCTKCRTLVQCDCIDLKESHGVMGRVHYLDCPTCSHPIVMSCTTSLLHGFPPPMIGHAHTGITPMARTEIGAFIATNPTGIGDRL